MKCFAVVSIVNKTDRFRIVQCSIPDLNTCESNLLHTNYNRTLQASQTIVVFPSAFCCDSNRKTFDVNFTEKLSRLQLTLRHDGRRTSSAVCCASPRLQTLRCYSFRNEQILVQVEKRLSNVSQTVANFLNVLKIECTERQKIYRCTAPIKRLNRELSSLWFVSHTGNCIHLDT